MILDLTREQRAILLRLVARAVRENEIAVGDEREHAQLSRLAFDLTRSLVASSHSAVHHPARDHTP